MSGDDASFAGRTVRDLDFSGSHLHSPSFEAARITDGWFLNAEISGFIGGLRVNDVEIAPLVSAELDRRFPDRVKLRATDPDGLADAWDMIEGIWRDTVERVRRLPERMWYERVDGEWSFVETLRHLIRATDGWLLRMVKGQPNPYHPWGLSFTSDPAALVVDPVAQPKLDDVLDVRRERMEEVRRTIEGTTAIDTTHSGEATDKGALPRGLRMEVGLSHRVDTVQANTLASRVVEVGNVMQLGLERQLDTGHVRHGTEES